MSVVFLEKLNPNYTIKITGHPANGRQFEIEGWVNSELTIGGGNRFDTFQAALSEGAGLLGDNIVGRTAQTAVSEFGGGGKLSTISNLARGANVSRAQDMSRSTWGGSNKPVFSMELLFFCLDSQDTKQDVTAKIKTLLRAVYPDVQNGLFKPPMGYNSTNTNTGKFTIQIGQWFRGTKMVIENFSMTPSKEVNINGKPISANGAITFSPYRDISLAEYKRYFLG